MSALPRAGGRPLPKGGGRISTLPPAASSLRGAREALPIGTAVSTGGIASGAAAAGTACAGVRTGPALAFSNQYKSQVRQRCQVAACSDRAA